MFYKDNVIFHKKQNACRKLMFTVKKKKKSQRYRYDVNYT